MKETHYNLYFTYSKSYFLETFKKKCQAISTKYLLFRFFQLLSILFTGTGIHQNIYQLYIEKLKNAFKIKKKRKKL